MKEIKRHYRLSQASVHLVTDRASLFTAQRMSGLPIRARHKHFKTICEHTFDNSPADSSSSSFKWWSSKQGLETLFHCSAILFATSQYISQRIFEHVLPCRRTTLQSCVRFFPYWTDSRFFFFFLKWWSKQRVETLYNCSVFLFASSQCLSTHFWACPSMS